MENVVTKALDLLPESIRETTALRLFGFLKIPVLFYLRPSVVKLDDQECIVKIALNRRSKNHLNSMYFGVLACGADCAGGLAAMRQIQRSGKKISLAFKDFEAQFLKRADGDVHFVNRQGKEITEFVSKVAACHERMNFPLEIIALVPDKYGDEPVATFKLTLSLKQS